MTQPFDAVILAAGRGSRLRDLTSAPKCLLRITGKSLIEQQIRSYLNCGAGRVIIVLGYEASQVEHHLREIGIHQYCTVVYNADFERHGNSFSLLHGLSAVDEACVFSDADVMLDQLILRDFLLSPSTSVLLGSGSAEDEECAKAYIDDRGRIRKLIDKRIPGPNEIAGLHFAGEAVGLLYLSGAARLAMLDVARVHLNDQAHWLDNWEHVVTHFLAEHHVVGRRTVSDRWIEIDTAEDYERAVAIFASEEGLQTPRGDGKFSSRHEVRR